MTAFVTKLLWAGRYTLGWLPFFLLYVLAMYAARGGTLSQVIYGSVTYLGPGYLLGFGVWWYADRIGVRKLDWGKFFVLHLTGGLFYSVLWGLIFVAELYLSTGASALKQFNLERVVWMLTIGLMVYAILCGLCTVARLGKQVADRELNTAKAENLRVQAEMAALRGQLDPHFLFNTLHSITALVREDPRRAEEALLKFGELLRHVISTKRQGADEVPLAEELAFVDRYLDLEALRLGNRLKVERGYDPEALKCWIPVFTVQPLVENSIRHAIAPRREGGVIRLSAALQKGCLTITVGDNGPGAEVDKWRKAPGVGLAAVRQRLELRHPGAGSLQVNTSPGNGFSVTLSLPAVHNAMVDSVS